MEQQPEKLDDRSFPERKGLKRKLEEGDEREISALATGGGDALLGVVAAQLSVLSFTFSWKEADFAAAKRATQILAELAKNDDFVDVIVEKGAVPVLVKHLQAPPKGVGDETLKLFEHEVEKGSASALGYLAIKPEYQLSIINLGHENNAIKNLVRLEGGIPPLVELIEFADSKVQRAAAGALRTLAFRNDANKNQIVDCNALPTLILLLGSEDAAVHYEAVGVIGNLVHSSLNIKKKVLDAGALQPVISLLSSCCPESQREAALLLGQFAATDSDCKAHIVQRGAVCPLIEMLQSPEAKLKEMSAFALGRLAQVNI